MLEEKVKHKVRKATSSYYSELLDGSARDARKYWGIINRVRGSEDRYNITEIKVQDEIVTVGKDAGRVAHQFNKF